MWTTFKLGIFPFVWFSVVWPLFIYSVVGCYWTAARVRRRLLSIDEMVSEVKWHWIVAIRWEKMSSFKHCFGTGNGSPVATSPNRNRKWWKKFFINSNDSRRFLGVCVCIAQQHNSCSHRTPVRQYSIQSTVLHNFLIFDSMCKRCAIFHRQTASISIRTEHLLNVW